MTVEQEDTNVIAEMQTHHYMRENEDIWQSLKVVIISIIADLVITKSRLELGTTPQVKDQHSLKHR